MLLRFGTDGRQLSVELKAPDMIQTGVGAHRVRLPITFDTRRTLPTGVPLHVAAQVSLAVQSDWLGFAQPDGPIVTNEYGPFDGYLILVVSDEQLAVVEDRRAGGDLRLGYRLDITLGYDPGPVEQQLDTAFGRGEHWPTARCDGELWIQNGPWQRLLEQSSSGTSLAIVVPVPLGRDTASTRAAAQLREAIRKVNSGEYPDAVLAARKAMEAFGNTWAAEASIAQTKPSDRTYEQRRTMLRHALWSLASLAAHSDAVGDDITWDRPRALAVIAAVSAFVACGAPPPAR